ncbi:hypothetical protein BST61_g2929 [Cercospora zeina]
MPSSPYLDNLNRLLGGNAYQTLFADTSDKPEMTLIQDHGKGWDCTTSRHLSHESALTVESGVIIVCDFDLTMTSNLGQHYGIDPMFFAHHSLRMREGKENMSIDNVFASLALKATTEDARLSIYESKPNLFLILVDRPVSISHLWLDDNHLKHTLSLLSKHSHYAVYQFMCDVFTGKWSRQSLAKSWTEQWAIIDRKLEGFSTSHDASFQMLIGAMTVLDSAANKKQAERATMLTLLAAIYLPLTLATGIFGMNIREIERSNPSWWWVVIVMVVLLTPSVCFVVYLLTKNRLWTRRQRRAQGVNDKMV